MKLILEGHDYRYAAEQIMMSILPDERPETGDILPGDDWARVTMDCRGEWATVTSSVCYKGRENTGVSRVRLEKTASELERSRLCQMAVKLSFYRAAVKLLPEKPVWGALTGIRPGALFTKMLKDGLSEEEAIRKMEKLYYVDRDRAELCAHTARASLNVEKSLGERDFALYIGIPFCPTRCAYCSFVSQSIERDMSLIRPFLDVLLKELSLIGEIVRELSLNLIAVYIGGGTPTTLSAEQLCQLIGHIRSSFNMENCREFCIEAGRPDTITEDKLVVMENGGVTRISINPQSMSEKVLSAIGRRHSPEDILNAYAMARKSTTADINMDLIAGLPGDSPQGFKLTLDEVIKLDPENITVHTLALKRGSRLLTQQGAELPDGKAVGQMLDYGRKALTEKGYLPYYLYRQKFMSGGFENIGWGKNGKESLYNILIMEELTSIIAAGGGGSTKLTNHSTGKVERFFDFKYPREYIDGFEKMAKDKKRIVKFYEENFS